MEKRIINPWQWQDERNYAQAVEIKQPGGILYCSGQAAVHPDGRSSTDDMRTQFQLALQNLEQVINTAGYACNGIARLTIYSTSSAEFIATCFDLYKEWIARHEVKTALTVLEVNGLFETLKVELEATVVR
ncbi:RidA family protein [Chitinophaga qingshengii]|uniref:RidA family protein n=1 Tax=Chitinophaga qingshengii TaxID=1569794 RepID=A0ABR7TYE0_9BACT|nr:RidA family protein [Chitinophaga qingshengii]MBC9934164.1 RidA family protein [Chitinophaga qingshengii]